MNNIKHDIVHTLLCLLVVVGVFYTSYGIANEMTGGKGYIPEIVFAWEYSIPFLAWTIFPYWFLNALYGLSFFVCETREERMLLLKRLLLAQVIAVVCFVFFPLHISWGKPETSGLSGFFYSSLASFDQPYNQAPSLHIILCVIFCTFYWHKLSKPLRIVSALLFILIGVSVLTTYQHHFIDIPTGVLVGALVLWLLPEKEYRLKKIVLHDVFGSEASQQLYAQTKRFWTLLYLSISLCSLALVLGFAGAFPTLLWLLYVSVSCLLVGCAYWLLGVTVFQKQRHGLLSFASTILLLPYLVAVRLNIAYWLKGKPRFRPITDTVSVGSIVQAKHYDCVVDVCAEFPCIASPDRYYSIPMLDRMPPPVDDILTAVDALQSNAGNGGTLVCCALGYERSVSVVIAWLVIHREYVDIESAIDFMKTKHPRMVLSPVSKENITKAIEKGQVVIAKKRL